MATVLWGKIYFKDTYAGKLQEEPGGRCVFTYDESYLESANPAIAYTLPLRKQPFISEQGLHPFFDNLVAEGWLKGAQARKLGISPEHRFGLLLGFGEDLAGAVSVRDPEPQAYEAWDHQDDATVAALLGHASLSGVQRKVLVVKENGQYRPKKLGELSTHIAKLASGNLKELIELEFLTTAASKVLLPDDDIVDMEIASVIGLDEPALIVRRFDRTPSGKHAYHFEEFNQLLGQRSGDDKYNGHYEDMANFIRDTPRCSLAEMDRLFQRILVCILLGNTDAHFKNFAMFHTRGGFQLTPAYDLVASAYYPEYQSIALGLAGKKSRDIKTIEPRHLLLMGQQFGLTHEAIISSINKIGKYLSVAQGIIEQSNVGSEKLRKQLLKMMEARWNGSFLSIGQTSLKRRNKGVKA
jgi:serine/threonine-protein kinase HipA